jgi:hypothetical protein
MMARPGVKVRIDGVETVQRELGRSGAQVETAMKRAMFDAVNEIARGADQLVPVDTGNLRASRMVDIKQVGQRVEAEVTYGGTGTQYALVQHENLELWHPPKPPGKSKVGGRQGSGPVEPGSGRGPKYLEVPFTQEVTNWPAGLVTRMRAYLTMYGG